MADEHLGFAADSEAARLEKRRAYAREYNKRKRAEKKAAQSTSEPHSETARTAPPPEAPSVKTGMTADDAEEMKREVALKLAEEKIGAQAISEDNRQMVHQEIRVDTFNILRRYVELTPSMCRARNCPFDAAKEAGATAWGDAPVAQKMSDGKTFGDRLIALREYHEATAHTVQQMDDHIISAGELAQRQWNPGQSIRNEFLTGAK